MSQAVSLRRVDVTGGNLSLMDYCTAGPQYASGGFIADSKPADRRQRLAAAVADPQQRDRRLVQRRVEPGLRGRRRRAGRMPPSRARRTRRSPTTPVSREKPYLFVDADGKLQRPRAVGAEETPAASPGPTARPPGRTLPLSATSSSPSRPTRCRRSTASSPAGRNLLLTPGVYDVARSIEVKRADTVVLGLGHATLTAVNGAIPLDVADVPGVIIAGVTIDAGHR